MTKLEEEIEKAFYDNMYRSDDNHAGAKAAAEVCKGYIERAFDAGYNRCWHGEYGATQAPSLTEFLKSEGITE